MLLVKLIHINMDKIKRPKLYTLPDTLQTVQHPPPSRSPCAACPAFGRVCRCVACCGRSGLHLARSALLPVLCSLSGCAGATWGELGQRPGWGVVSPVSSDQNKKGTFFANTHPTFTKRRPSDCASLQKFRKIQKDPSSGLICAILDRKKGAL